ncbi:MAG: NAD(P)H-binding protein, partial [Pseudomonadota bacterium]|nr:NAD(P)H-binding protein [Pseudomonadota bacterium]
FAVRCLARTPAKVQGLAAAGADVVQGDMADEASLRRALDGVQAVYVSVQTLAAQPGGPAGQDFMAAETQGMRNIAAACTASGVRRLIYVTSLGIDPNSPSEWVRGRWAIEQALLTSGLDVTIIRPGMIVGKGGLGFGMTVAQAKQRVALVLGTGRLRMRHIAVDDLTYYLRGVLDDPRAHGQVYEVGGDELYAKDRMIDLTAEVLGRRPPIKIHVPLSLLAAVAPLIERLSKAASKGAIKAIADGLAVEGVGDPMPIRAILPRPPLSYRAAVQRALAEEKS